MSKTTKHVQSQQPAVCPVCCEQYTKQLRKPIQCSFCQFEACAACQKTYLLSSAIDARCMHCFQGWNYGFLQSIFPRAFLNSTYADHRARILFEREKQMLPEAQLLVQNYQSAEQERKQIKEKRDEIRQLHTKVNELDRAILDHYFRIRQLSANDFAGDESITRQKRKRHRYIFPCRHDACRGFLATDEDHPTKLVCGVCEAVACAQCGEFVEGDIGNTENTRETRETRETRHVCEEGDKATFAVLKSNSKPCPSCAVPTSKIDGCHQMWCVCCHTAWDWKSGEKLRGTIHNPHYFEYLRQSTDGDIPRQPGDVPLDPCGRRPISGWGVRQALVQYKHLVPNISPQIFKECGQYMYQLTNAIVHMDQISIPRARQGIEQFGNNNPNRLQFLLNKIDEAGYKKSLAWKEHRIEKLTVLIDLMETAVAVCTDTITIFMNGNASLRETVDTLMKFQQFQKQQCDRSRRLFNLSFLEAELQVNPPPCVARTSATSR